MVQQVAAMADKLRDGDARGALQLYTNATTQMPLEEVGGTDVCNVLGCFHDRNQIATFCRTEAEKIV